MESHARISNALDANRVPELQRMGIRIEPDASGNRVGGSGQDAVVSRVRDAHGDLRALRVAREYDGGRFWYAHYSAMGERLPQVARTLVIQDIEIIPDGITVVGRKHIAMLTEWIDGPTLGDAARRAAKSGSTHILRALAQAIRELSYGLRDVRVTHGNLSPANVMIRPSGDLVCVDLDTMQWPGARHRDADVGTPGFRYPGRNATPAQQDAFATLVLYASALILAEQPERVMSGETLLFSPSDLADPAGSRLISELRHETGHRGRELLAVLRRACSPEAFRTPELLDEAFDIGNDEGPADVPVVPVDRHDLDLSETITRLRNLYGDGEAVRPVYESDTEFEETWPGADVTELTPVVQPDTPARSQAWAVRSGRADGAFSTLAQEDAEVGEIERRIDQLHRQHNDADILREARNLDRRQLPVKPETRQVIRQARERQDVRERLAYALDTSDQRRLIDLAVSGDLAMLGDTDRTTLLKVLQALELPSLERAIQTDDDQLILMWFDEDVFPAGSMSAEIEERVQLARERSRWRDDLRMAQKRRSVSDIQRLMDEEPKDGLATLSDTERSRVRQVLLRQSALAELDRALDAGSHQRVILALSAVERTGARIEDDRTWDAVQAVIERARLLEQVLAAARKHPPDDRVLAALLPTVRSMGLTHDPLLSGDESIEKLQAMVTRGAALRRIQRGIAQDDDRAIRLAAFPDITGALAMLTDEERARVEIARSRKMVRRFD